MSADVVGDQVPDLGVWIGSGPVFEAHDAVVKVASDTFRSSGMSGRTPIIGNLDPYPATTWPPTRLIAAPLFGMSHKTNPAQPPKQTAIAVHDSHLTRRPQLHAKDATGSGS